MDTTPIDRVFRTLRYFPESLPLLLLLGQQIVEIIDLLLLRGKDAIDSSIVVGKKSLFIIDAFSCIKLNRRGFFILSELLLLNLEELTNKTLVDVGDVLCLVKEVAVFVLRGGEVVYRLGKCAKDEFTTKQNISVEELNSCNSICTRTFVDRFRVPIFTMTQRDGNIRQKTLADLLRNCFAAIVFLFDLIVVRILPFCGRAFLLFNRKNSQTVPSHSGLASFSLGVYKSTFYIR